MSWSFYQISLDSFPSAQNPPKSPNIIFRCTFKDVYESAACSARGAQWLKHLFFPVVIYNQKCHFSWGSHNFFWGMHNWKADCITNTLQNKQQTLKLFQINQLFMAAFYWVLILRLSSNSQPSKFPSNGATSENPFIFCSPHEFVAPFTTRTKL